jgi:CheY-like chemotaxis protein
MPNDMDTKPVILYAEDDFDDFESLKDAVAQLTDQYDLIQAKNGTEVVDLLENDMAETHPCVIILDLNMPIMNGKEVLAWLKKDDRYKNIPVMVFTTSSRDEDLKLCQTHKCTFFRKPTLYRDLLHIAQTMLDMCDGKSIHNT